MQKTKDIKINILLDGVEQFRSGHFSSAHGLDYVTMEQFVTMLKTGWNDSIRTAISAVRMETDKEKRSALKKELPAFRPCIGDGVINGLVPIDEELGLRANIDQKHIVLRARSVSGKDFFSLIRINDPVDHKDYNRVARALNHELGILTNKGQHSYDRARYLSFDPYLYYNPEAQPYTVIVPEPVKRPVVEMTIDKLNQTAFKVKEDIKWLTDFNIDITGDYNQWRDLGFAIANTFHEGGRQFYHDLSKISDKYNEEHADRQYDLCDASSDGRDDKITIGTFFHLVNEAKDKYYSELYKLN